MCVERWKDGYGFDGNRKTVPECKVKEIFKNNGIDYQYGFPLGGKYTTFYRKIKTCFWTWMAYIGTVRTKLGMN